MRFIKYLLLAWLSSFVPFGPLSFIGGLLPSTISSIASYYFIKETDDRSVVSIKSLVIGILSLFINLQILDGMENYVSFLAFEITFGIISILTFSGVMGLFHRRNNNDSNK